LVFTLVLKPDGAELRVVPARAWNWVQANGQPRDMVPKKLRP